ncbi:MAG: DUF5610 domain-containing protein [Gemmatimonadetes bacterium]|nr:DUF5610 domain-containing protein [Gemmatimonadota bacterium]MBT6147271.1 DUF5610 domain-containing protein [Gemmatimonadota bacterium]MBT7862926.1 DUF5610 domain-containing protein [Gemmatimonadota bacterium]
MQVGTTQSQHSLIASISVRTQIDAQAVVSSGPEGSESAVLLSVGSEINIEYASKVLDDNLAASFDAAFVKAGLDLNTESILSSGLDFSPQATANRILEFSTSFFGGFTANHAADEDGGPGLGGFKGLIRGAVEEGFSQAKGILSGIGDISGDVSDDIDTTFGLVMEGIDAFGEEEEEESPLDAPVPPPEVIDADESGLLAI